MEAWRISFGTEITESSRQSMAYIRKMRDNERRVHEPSEAPAPSGFAAIGVFLFFVPPWRVWQQLRCFGAGRLSIASGA